MRRVDRIDFPAESRLAGQLGEATFHDAFEADLADPGLGAAEIAARLLRATPAWVEALLALRNRAVSLVGLKDVGRLGAVDGRPGPAYRPGDALSIFEVLSVSDEEIVLGIDDRHLDVRISFLKRRRDRRWRYAVSSWVRTHNALGRLYMAPVGRVHPLVVRQAVRGLVV